MRGSTALGKFVGWRSRQNKRAHAYPFRKRVLNREVNTCNAILYLFPFKDPVLRIISGWYCFFTIARTQSASLTFYTNYHCCLPLPPIKMLTSTTLVHPSHCNRFRDQPSPAHARGVVFCHFNRTEAGTRYSIFYHSHLHNGLPAILTFNDSCKHQCYQ